LHWWELDENNRRNYTRFGMTTVTFNRRPLVSAGLRVAGCAVSILIGSGVASAQKAPAEQQPVTFTKDIAPILQRSCVSCHRPGEMAPMSLQTYDDARPWARAMKARTAAREMPPWHIDRTVGIQEFKDDPSLSDDEIAKIAKWVDSGAPKGNPADMPPLRQFADATQWQIGKPDLVVKYPAYKVPAAGPDLFGSLYTTVDLKEDRYIKAIQTRPVGPGSRRVVHHALTFAVDPSDDSQSNGDDSVSDAGQFLVEYASGKNGEIYPENSGVLLQAGKRLKVDYHLHSIGEAVNAEIEVGIVLYPKGEIPKHVRWSKQLAQPTSDLDIPAGATVRRDGYVVLNSAARITAFQPHMHIRGKYQCLELIYPTGGSSAKTELVSCANFNYNWHLVYNYADRAAPLVPKGTILHVISWHDNSAGNKFNPDPRNWVGDGQRTIDEMGFAWIGWYDLTDDEYKGEQDARKAERQRRTTTGGQQQQ
jgi:mono/diheme cytochrome c family protein